MRKEDVEEESCRKKIDVDLCKKLLNAAVQGDDESVWALLQREGVDARYFELSNWMAPKTSLLLASGKGHEKVVRVLLDHGGETQKELDCSFLEAAWAGHVGIVTLLLERGADPSIENNYAFRGAAGFGNFEVVKLLLKDWRVDPGAQDHDAIAGPPSAGQLSTGGKKS